VESSGWNTVREHKSFIANWLLNLLLTGDFPKIWVPSWENQDLRLLLWLWHRMVQARTRAMNQLQAVALNEGLRSKEKLWRERMDANTRSISLSRWEYSEKTIYVHEMKPGAIWACRGWVTLCQSMRSIFLLKSITLGTRMSAEETSRLLLVAAFDNPAIF